MLQHHPKDILAAGPDAIAAAFGVPSRNPHPLADELTTAPLSRLAYAAGTAVRPLQPFENDRTVMGRGMTSADFSATLAVASMTLANRRFSALAEHRAFCAEIECRDFRPMAIATTDIDGELARVDDRPEISQGFVLFGNGTEAQLRTYARTLRASRAVIVNDQVGILADAAAQLGTAGARTEAREVYAVLESNPTLDDGELVFHEDHGNIIASALDFSSLGQGMTTLRMMTLIGGNKADLPATHLVVAADLELSARKLIHENGLQITTTATSRLPSGRWYLLPSPEAAPTVGVLKLKGSAQPILVESWQEEFAFDGASMRARCDTGAVLVARTLIRGGV
jgi:hypothetical protein